MLGPYGNSEPVYPACKLNELNSTLTVHRLINVSPVNTTGLGDWKHTLGKAKKLFALLTTEEKAWMTTGANGLCVGNIAAIPRLGFDGICLQDGLLGIRAVDLANVFPAGVTLAATWDLDMLFKRGEAMGEEFKAKGGHVYLG